MHRFLQHHAADVTGVLSGFDRLRFRGTLRLIANARGLMSLMAHLGVLVKDFKGFALGISAQVRAAIQAVAAQADRPLVYLESYTTDKEAVARQLMARDRIQSGLIGVLACVERCQSFDLHSDKAKGWLLVTPAVRKCQHYYLYYQHERFGFLHVRLQSWLPLTLWVCLNGREWLAQQLTAAGLPFTRQGNCVRPDGALGPAQALLEAQVTGDWAADLAALAQAVNPRHATLFGDFPLHYYWSLEESEWASDVLFRSPTALGTLYPRLIRHGVEALSCAEVMRYLGKRVNQDGSIPLAFQGEVLTDLRPAHRPRAASGRRGTEAVRLKYRVNHNWVKMYDKAPDILRVETVINDARDLKVWRRAEGEAPTARKRWRRLRKGVVDVPRRAELSQQANSRYVDALAAVDTTTALGDLVATVCRRVRWHGRPVRGLNPLSGPDAELLEAVNRGEFTITGFRNRDLRACLFGVTARDPKLHRRQSGQVTRRIRLLRAHGLVKKISGTHRYQLTAKGRVIITALVTARAANPRRLLEAAA
jgi:hypothetical protein